MSDLMKTADRQPPVSDPAVYDWWRAMRNDQPVRRDPLTGAWNVYRYADVAAVLADPATFSSEWPKLIPGVLSARHLDTTDPPRHRELRGVFATEFTGRAVGRLEPRITRIAGELLDTFTTGGRADLVTDPADHPGDRRSARVRRGHHGLRLPPLQRGAVLDDDGDGPYRAAAL